MRPKSAAEKTPRSKCFQCGRFCCRYITVKIPAPRTLRDFDGLLWQLSHENVSAFRDAGGWHLIIYNRCRHLCRSGKCGIYENRPITCREHSSESCEYDGPIAESAAVFFDSAEALESFCRKRFKTWDRRC
jgi:Fe-S-cluster containining protein